MQPPWRTGHWVVAWLALGCSAKPEHTDPHVVTPAAAPSSRATGAAQDSAEHAALPEGLAAPLDTPKEAAQARAPGSSPQAKVVAHRPPDKAAPARSAVPQQDPGSATRAPTPAPQAPPEPKAAAARKTVVPSTAHVRVELGRGMQSLLDADPRMQPWLQRVMRVVDGCYATARKAQPQARGVIRVRVTMHDRARPTADLRDLPAALSSVVACATGPLMRNRMPLFTGPEGQTHDLAIHFTP